MIDTDAGWHALLRREYVVAVVSDANMLSELLLATPLGGRAVRVLEHDAGDATLSVGIDAEELLACWSAARGIIDQTGRWPVAALSWSHVARLDQARLGRPGSGAGERALAEIRAAQFPAQPFSDYLTFHLNATRQRCGAAPAESQIRRSLEPDAPEVALELWLMDWEDQNFPGLGAADATYLDWLPARDALLMFPPTASGPQTLVYHGFWSAESVPGVTTERLIAILDYWQARYGAELVANFGTILQFVVARPPETVDEAWDLAVDQGMLAPDTFNRAGVPARDHARLLVGRRTWLLHHRP
ncbi:MAG: DUF4253 domain-containing protein [Solirubrobacteraceae bacterium]